MSGGSSNSIKRLLAAIGYPERMSEVAVPFTLRVDGIEVFAEETDGRLVLSYALTDDESLVVQLAAYAAGRMLKEDAVLAYGGVGVAANHQAAKPPDFHLAGRNSRRRRSRADPALRDFYGFLRVVAGEGGCLERGRRSAINACVGGDGDTAMMQGKMENVKWRM